MDQHKIENLINSVESNQPMNLDLLAQFIRGVASRSIPVSSIEKWLKSVHRNGISVEETTVLTREMMESGSILNWNDNRLVVDKHSTGGVGDKMSLMLAPALAACGLKIPMLAGRGLGHTGGTIDKLESIPGFNCLLSPEQMQKQVNEIGCCIAAQNDSIAPADGLLYAIRDVTNTIDSIPLITASIISKKAAEGLGSLVLDVKCGSAAFMKTQSDAEALAKSMVGAAKGLGINAIAQITKMDYPIGKYVGNSLEVIGSIEVLQGNGSSDTRDIVVIQGSSLLFQSGLVSNHHEAEKMISGVIDDGQALEFFKQMCISQGVDKETAEALIKNPGKVLKPAKNTTRVKSSKSGFVDSINSMTLAEIARKHGAGRFTIDDKIIPEIGFEILIEHAQEITEGHDWLVFHHNEKLTEDDFFNLSNSLEIVSQKPKQTSRLISVIS